jgi:hypothetical protein
VWQNVEGPQDDLMLVEKGDETIEGMWKFFFFSFLQTKNLALKATKTTVEEVLPLWYTHSYGFVYS